MPLSLWNSGAHEPAIPERRPHRLWRALGEPGHGLADGLAGQPGRCLVHERRRRPLRLRPRECDAGSAPVSYGDFPGTEYVNVREVFADGGYTSPGAYHEPHSQSVPLVRCLWFLWHHHRRRIVLGVIALVQAQSLPERIGSREATAALVFDGILIGIAAYIYMLGLG